MAERTHSHSERHLIMNRLARIEGHVRKIRSMVDEGQDCPAILMQLAAVRSAINKVGQAVLEDHVESCLLGAGSEEATAKAWGELKDAFDVIF
jgi:DNA-binding FrmR family transcriptional regulator